MALNLSLNTPFHAFYQNTAAPMHLPNAAGKSSQENVAQLLLVQFKTKISGKTNSRHMVRLWERLCAFYWSLSNFRSLDPGNPSCKIPE